MFQFVVKRGFRSVAPRTMYLKEDSVLSQAETPLDACAEEAWQIVGGKGVDLVVDREINVLESGMMR
ncbi:hypothetical protein [Peribacillus sp. ACCC06369]|uniref:hypothetical protein n=1 Tax=Peribacillus sp. ACCC06369 TaxID=3055860 RepID=UPI0025A265A6|nr:hypothetical protein [Peribacillus sp. ACCC06369]